MLKRSFFLLALFLLLFPGLYALAAPEQTPQDAVSLARAWSARSNDLALLTEDASMLEAEVNRETGSLAEAVKNAQTESRRLLSLFQVSRGHPTEQMALLMRLKGINAVLSKRIAPLKAISSAIRQRLDEADALEKDMTELTQGEKVTPEQAAYTQALTRTKQMLSSAAAKMDRVLNPAEATRERLQTSIRDMEGNLRGIWKEFYFASAASSLQAYLSTWDLLKSWASTLSMRLAFAYPQTTSERLQVGLTFVISVLILGAMGYLCLRGARRLPEPWRTTLKGAIKNSWPWVTFGAALLAASSDQRGGAYFAVLILGVLILVWGISDLTGRLRAAAVPALEGKPSLLFRMYIPASLGVLMLFSYLPGRVLMAFWAVAMIIFLARLHVLRAKNWSRRGRSPLLERVCAALMLVFGALSLGVNLFGYARLAILLFMLLFAAVNTIILASALTAFSHILVNKLLNKNHMPIRHAVADAVAVPVAWAASLLCTLPWFWAMPGANYIIGEMLGAHYDIGQASFDFSKILLIVIVFFLFRSFISLGKTSLAHLPRSMPNVESGVIPPLQTMLSYGLWALFFLIMLNFLGVSLTSLAVIAGGISVGIGFGMQNIFNNLVSGIMIIFGRTLLVGDYIEAGGTQGTVQEISIRSTTVETPDKALVSIPNSNLMTGQFTNWTRVSRIVRKTIPVGVAYGSNVQRVKDLLLVAAQNNEEVLKDPAPVVLFNNFGASTLDFVLYVFVSFDTAARALSDLRTAIERSFALNGIEMPFPQLDVHLLERKEKEN